MSGDSVFQRKFLIELITAYFCQVVSSRIKEHCVDKAFSAFYSKRLARSDLFIKLQKTFLIIRGSILRKTCKDLRLLAEIFNDLSVGTDAQCPDQLCDRYFSGPVDAHIKNVIRISFILEPCSSVRDNCTGIQFFSDLIMGNSVIDTG